MEQNNSSMPEFCVNNCGFYGSPIYNQMCSKCFKQLNEDSKPTTPLALSKPITPSYTPSVESIIPAVANVEVTTEAPKIAEVSSEVVQEAPVEAEVIIPKKIQTNKGRCFQCKAKIPLAKQTINKCRCDYVYCDSHRYADKHDCDFDFVGQDRTILAKNNPKLNERHTGGRSFTRLED
ncbi:hypothetical protein K7432_000607 [Basidiobolus ranarum]|uniref:A20-type domain-containing protein n=1 Tax=Basidiobolus ranarum TaxID=34480 RepID=A0ABR2X4N8_9FUNG